MELKKNYLRKRVAAVLFEVAAGRDDSDGLGVIKFSRESDSQESSSNDELNGYTETAASQSIISQRMNKFQTYQFHFLSVKRILVLLFL